MPNTGENPEKGIYICKKCGQEVKLNDSTDTLPPCPSFYHTEYKKQRK